MELKNFAQRFKEEGPGAVGRDLDHGVELMKAYKEELSKYESDRQELANAERLFDLPITMYPDLLQVQKQVKGMEQVYAIYEEQGVSKTH